MASAALVQLFRNGGKDRDANETLSSPGAALLSILDDLEVELDLLERGLLVTLLLDRGFACRSEECMALSRLCWLCVSARIKKGW